jgi:hypothetical protein
MSSVAVAIAGPSIAGISIANYNANRRATNDQQGANESAIAADQAARERALGEFTPWNKMEDQARTSMADILGYNGQDAAASAYDALMKSPAFQMRLKTGQEGIDRSAASAGGLFSGNTGKALVQYGQDLGSQEFQSEYNRRAGMMDWAYGNTGNRAKSILGAGDALASGYLRQGQIAAQGDMALPNAMQGGYNNLLAGVGAAKSLYGMSGSSGAYPK